jgi:superfamily II DNA/RNA helicase
VVCLQSSVSADLRAGVGIASLLAGQCAYGRQLCVCHRSFLPAFPILQLQAKIIVFMSTCNQVRYAYEALRRLRPGVPLRALHGKMKQMKRLAAFYDFCEVRLGIFDPEAVDVS